jgi:hypothetical protein
VISIDRPDDDGEEVYRRAAARTRNAALRTALLGVSAQVGARARQYVELAEHSALFRLLPEKFVEVTNEQLANVYDRAFVQGSERALYDRIRASAKYQLCPLCGDRVVQTIDHYLPQGRYPELATFPANLVPSCSDCNKTKLHHRPREHFEQLFHPYFDDWGSHRILSASVTVDYHVSVDFSIVEVRGFPAAEIPRAQHHFFLLHLGEFYSSRAAVELVEGKDTFRKHFADGVDVLRDELRLTARSRERINVNSWRAALYRGLAASDDFCNAGFELIEEAG